MREPRKVGVKNPDTDKNYENLANAIVFEAVQDYKVVLKIIKKVNLQIESEKNKEEPNYEKLADLLRIKKSNYFEKGKLDKFFRSEWYKTLTNVDGDWLMEQLQKEVFGGLT